VLRGAAPLLPASPQRVRVQWCTMSKQSNVELQRERESAGPAVTPGCPSLRGRTRLASAGFLPVSPPRPAAPSAPPITAAAFSVASCRCSGADTRPLYSST